MARQGRTPTGNTPHRTVRSPDAIWLLAQRIAAKRGETMTDVVDRGLRNYIARHRHLLDEDEAPEQSG